MHLLASCVPPFAYVALCFLSRAEWEFSSNGTAGACSSGLPWRGLALPSASRVIGGTASCPRWSCWLCASFFICHPHRPRVPHPSLLSSVPCLQTQATYSHFLADKPVQREGRGWRAEGSQELGRHPTVLHGSTLTPTTLTAQCPWVGEWLQWSPRPGVAPPTPVHLIQLSRHQLGSLPSR